MKTGIITYTDANNPGAQLQAYALQEAVKAIAGGDVFQISHRKFDNRILSKPKSLKDIVYNMYYLKDYGKRKCRNDRYESFREHYLNLTEPCYTEVDKEKLNDSFDTFIAGSDQIWNCQKGIYQPFFLGFVREEKKKIAYAASMGRVDVPQKYSGQFRELISGFDHVSVREKQVADYLQDIFHISSDVVCDPVFLIDKDKWSEAASHGQVKVPKRYIFVFTTEMTEEFRSVLKEVQKQTNLPIVSLRQMAGIRSKVCLDAGPLEFIRYIRDSELVVTNSFHATAFSVVFNKDFYCVPHSTRGSRLASLLDILGLQDRLVYSGTLPAVQKIEYPAVNEKLSAYKAGSLAFLKRALMDEDSNRPKQELAIESVVREGRCYSCRACENICPQNAISMHYGNDGILHPYVDQKMCISCKKCQRVCPADGEVRKEGPLNVYYGKNRDAQVRRMSSSGGIFSALSDFFLENNGTVYGCVQDGWTAFTARAETPERRNQMRGSKYVQGDMRDCYRLIEKDVLSGRKVMFSGTPCQCWALKKYCAANHVNTTDLYIVDIICHGTNSPILFQEYGAWLEKQFNSRMISYHFRPNILHGVNQKAYAVFENGMQYFAPNSMDPYYQTFLGDCMLKEACYHCAFASLERVSDITIGDLWDKTIGSGFSQIMVNTEKGKALLGFVKPNLDIHEYDLSGKLQPQLKHPVTAPKNRSSFLEAYRSGRQFPAGYSFVDKRKTEIIIAVEKVLCKLHLFDISIRILNNFIK